MAAPLILIVGRIFASGAGRKVAQMALLDMKIEWLTKTIQALYGM